MPQAVMRCERGIGNLPWGALHGDLGVGVDFESGADGGKQLREQLGRKQAGRSAAQVDGVDPRGAEWRPSCSPRHAACAYPQ